MRPIREQYPVWGDVDSSRLQSPQFLGQLHWVDHHPGPHDALYIWIQHARRHDMELIGLIAKAHRMPCVIPATIPCDNISLCRQQIRDPAFSLIPPLGPDNHMSRHNNSSMRIGRSQTYSATSVDDGAISFALIIG